MSEGPGVASIRACGARPFGSPVRLRKRPRSVEPRTIAIARMSKRERLVRQMNEPDDGKRRLPMTRDECRDGPRPCPFVSCRHHLYLDVHPVTGNIRLNFPDLEVEELEFSCSLDLADRGPLTLDELGALLNVTRERARQLELLAMTRLEEVLIETGLDAKQLLPDVHDEKDHWDLLED